MIIFTSLWVKAQLRSLDYCTQDYIWSKIQFLMCLHLKHNGEIKENSDANCSLNPQIMREKPRETGGKFYPFAAKINLNLKKWWIHTYRLYYYENTSLKYTITTL